LQERVFTSALERTWLADPSTFKDGVEALWDAMNEGKRFFLLGKLLRFNGGLFVNPEALPLSAKQLQILLRAARKRWADVQPAIFGTLIERALDPAERHRLGAHFTPTSYVERLLLPTIEQPLRSEWDCVRVQVRQLVPPNEVASDAKVARASAIVRRFHEKLCSTIVLDPACGSGNFLYLALNLFKRLESEVLAMLYDLECGQLSLGEEQMVTPRQFRGLEVRSGSKDVAELVLWIGYLQWHHKMYGGTKSPPEPILRDYRNIEWRDAVLAYDAIEAVKDPKTHVAVTRWDGETMKASPVTGEQVPDESAQVPVVRYSNPRIASWPDADFIVGNPPFIGTKRMRAVLGDGYVDALRAVYASQVEDNADYVMYWWENAARALQRGNLQSFGLITTNSATQAFNRRLVKRHLDQGARIVWAIPDHPWTDSIGAAVRIAMTCASKDVTRSPVLLQVAREEEDPDSGEGAARIDFLVRTGDVIREDLRMGANVLSARPLRANTGISGMGVALHGNGFILTPDLAASMRVRRKDKTVRQYLAGRDLVQRRRELYVIDFSFQSEDEAMAANPKAYQHVAKKVLPKRKLNRREAIKNHWWRFGWERPLIRRALKGLPRYIATTETAKHRVFQFVDGSVLADHSVIVIASADAFVLGVLSSSPSLAWIAATGGKLESRPRYNKNVCFSPFPFPDASAVQQRRIAKAAEDLEAHRKRQQEEHPALTMTAMYNILAKVRDGVALGKKEQSVHDAGLIEVLARLHDELDAAVLEAYGWSNDLSADETLEKLVLLNLQRSREEAGGKVKWLRPDYQQRRKQSGEMAEELDGTNAGTQLALPWPEDLPQQVVSIRDLLAASSESLTANDVARFYRGVSATAVVPALETLEALGMAASFEDQQRRWRGLARTTGERPLGNIVTGFSNSPPANDGAAETG
jgi:restriction-modification enzyme MmeI-like protein